MGNKPIRDIGGCRFGRLVVIHDSHERVRGNTVWQATCDCGNTIRVNLRHLHAGNTRSCGCLQRELTIANNKLRATHGLTHSPTFISWSAMFARCRNKNHEFYSHYAGRGIDICERWTSFESFLEDMGPRPSLSHSLDRIDNSLGYSPGNCRWATQKEQIRNRRNTLYISIGDDSKPLAEWCETLHLNYYTVYGRIRRGISPIEALELR